MCTYWAFISCFINYVILTRVNCNNYTCTIGVVLLIRHKEILLQKQQITIKFLTFISTIRGLSVIFFKELLVINLNSTWVISIINPIDN